MVLGTSKGKRGRGKSQSLKLAKLKNQGVRLPIQICKVSGRPYGEASEKFTSELGIVIRQFAPQNVPSWTDISEEDKETLVAYLQEGFKFTNEPYAIESILNLMHDRYKSYRHDLRQRFRSFPTMESALADPPENMEKETWKFLCEKWSDKDYKVRCGKNKLNREKLKVLHTAGSKAFRKVQYDERDRATGEELELVELYKKTHFSEKKEAWVHADAEIRHYKLEKRQEKAIEEGSCPISDEQLSIEVFGQKVGYIRGLGRGRKPSTTLSGKLTRAQLERDNEAATREAEEQRRINEELVGRIQILESDRTEYNAKVDFLMQQISQRKLRQMPASFRQEARVSTQAYDKAADAAKQGANEAMNAGQDVKNKVASTAEDMTEKTKETAGTVAEKTQDLAEKAKQRAGDAWDAVKDTTQKIKETVVGNGKAAAQETKQSVKQNAETVERSMNMKNE
ncbi:unnamed protein product [Camellia sinensis]